MTLLAGTVTVNPDGTVTTVPNSMSKAIYEEFADNFLADAGVAMPQGSDSVGIKRGFATLATRLSAAVIDHITTHGEVTVTVGVGDAGIQRDNTGGNPPTLAPAAPVALTAGEIS